MCAALVLIVILLVILTTPLARPGENLQKTRPTKISLAKKPLSPNKEHSPNTLLPVEYYSFSMP